MAYPAQVREGALEFVRSGGSARGAARRFGVSLGIVCKWCRRAGIPLRRDRRGGPVHAASSTRVACNIIEHRDDVAP